MVSTLKPYQCYSAGPGLFPRDLPNGQRETLAEAQTRVRKLNETISAHPYFDVITPPNINLAEWESFVRSRVCMFACLLNATRCDIIFADVTPFGGREPDSGTVAEAVAGALSGGLLVLWADPLTTFAEKYQDAPVHPDSELDLHYNLMLEQLFYASWESHFGFSVPVFPNLSSAVNYTAAQIDLHGLNRASLLSALEQTGDLCIPEAVRHLVYDG